MGNIPGSARRARACGDTRFASSVAKLPECDAQSALISAFERQPHDVRVGALDPRRNDASRLMPCAPRVSGSPVAT